MSFDPQSFMDQTLDTGSTTQIPAPEGDWHAVIVSEPQFEEFYSEKKQQTYTKMTVLLETSDPEVTSVTEREPTQLRFQTFIDLTPEGKFDMGTGKNLGLNRLREATGTNRPGFRLSDLVGKSLIASVEHRVNPNDDSQVFAEVRKVRAE